MLGRRAAALLIILLAAALRLWHLDLTNFAADEAILSHIAEDMVRLGRVPLSGPLSSLGLSTPPHFIYFLVPLVAISRDPAFISGCIALFNVGGVAATTWLGWRAFGPMAGLIAGLLLAVNPYAIAYSRRIWQPDVLAPLAALFFVALDLALISRRSWWAATAFPIAVVASLMHSSFVLLVPLLLAPAIVLVLTRRWLQLGVAIVASLAITIPFVLYEFQISWADYPNFRYFSSQHTWVDLESLRWFTVIATGWQAPQEGVVPPAQRVLPSSLVQAGAGLELLLLIASIAGAVGALFRFRRRLHCDTPLRLAGVLLWLLLPVVLSIRHWQPLYSHYFFATFPAPFLLIGAALAQIRYPIARLTDLVKIGGLVAVVLVAFVQVASTVGGLTYQASVDADPCLPTPLGRVESTEQEVAQLGHAFGSTRAIIELDAQGAKPMAYLLRSDFPDVYLATPILPNETPWLVGEVGLGPNVAVGAPWRSSVDVGRVLTRFEHPNARYAEHITLVDAAFSSEPRPDQNVFAALIWLVDADAKSNRSVVWQVELRDATGRIFAPSTSESHVPGELRGQRIVSWFSVDARRDVLPAELATGAYRFVIQLLDTSSIPAVPIPWVNSLGDSAGTVELPIQLGPLRHCDL